MANTLAYFVSPSATMKKMINSDSSFGKRSSSAQRAIEIDSYEVPML